jgi:MurNAc alpha-1-phosphate uridylyltransferase
MRPVMRPVMLFAAGFGTRMGALTADRPKPLIPVAGRPLIDHALAIADAARASRRVVNLHWQGARLAAHLAGRRDVALSWERAILDTGGGLRAALPLLGPGPVFTLNTDAVWTGPNPLVTLAAAWAPGRMDALLLLAPPAAGGPAAAGDFDRDAAGRLARGRGLRFLGAQLIDPAALAGIAGPAFSLNAVWDRLIARGRLAGVLHPGGWCDVGTPEGIARGAALLAPAADG